MPNILRLIFLIISILLQPLSFALFSFDIQKWNTQNFDITIEKHGLAARIVQLYLLDHNWKFDPSLQATTTSSTTTTMYHIATYFTDASEVLSASICRLHWLSFSGENLSMCMWRELVCRNFHIFMCPHSLIAMKFRCEFDDINLLKFVIERQHSVANSITAIAPSHSARTINIYTQFTWNRVNDAK